MAITVTMIEEKEFKTKVRGYDPVEVDEFLDAICDEMIDMQNTIQTLREQLKQKTEQSASFAPLPVPPVAPAPARHPRHERHQGRGRGQRPRGHRNRAEAAGRYPARL